ncbi:MAG TPA: multicopper oxidase domain-containing protein [Ktedonobacteraceae bacterium]
MSQPMTEPSQEQNKSVEEVQPSPGGNGAGKVESRVAANGRVAYLGTRSPRPNTARVWWIMAVTGAAMIILLLGSVLAGLSRSTASTTTSASANTSANTTTDTNTSSAPTVVVPPHNTYNAQIPPVPAGNTVNIRLTMNELLIAIAPNVAYHAWSFNNSVPGPILHVRQGQTVNVTLTNQGSMAHSIDFHAAQVPWNVDYQAIQPGKSFSFTWRANYPGVFMYHCGTPTVIYHMANGMYGTIIVDPANGWAPAQQYALVQSEFYTHQIPDGSFSVDATKMMSGAPDYVVFNGYVNQYKDAPLTAKVGQRIRLFILNAGPSQFSAFHVIGALFSDVYIDGNPANHMVGNQTITIPPGGGVVVEMVIPTAGLYPFVTHSFADASKGALGGLKVVP